MSATTTGTARPLETGWLPDTPVGDTLLRRFVHNQADVNEVLARASRGRAERHEGVVLTDAGSPVAFFNQAVVTAPLAGPDDPRLDVVDGFFAGGGRPATLLSIWPTPDLTARGWALVGHPAVVVRAPGPVSYRRRPDVGVRLAEGTDDHLTAERIVVEGFPLDEARGAPPGTVLPEAIAGAGVEVRLGLLEGDPVGTGLVHVGHGVVNLCTGATLTGARRRGVWQALVWARVATAPDLPAVAYTSDLSRPGFERMGFLPVTRFTLWCLPG